VGLWRGARSLASLVAVMLVFGVGGGLYQRVFLWPAGRLWPRHRDRLMWSFMARMGGWVLAIFRMGGASFHRRGRLPAGTGPRLVLMNHQSILDVPTIFLLTYPEIPQIVTRRSYGRHVPLVSLMLRILEYPLVEPESDPRGAISVLKRAARRGAPGVLLFPEGHRSRDGSIGPFETGGVRVVLAERPAPVFLIVTDGFWVAPRVADFAFRVHRLHGETEVLGPFQPPAAAAEIPAFVERMRATMIEHLAVMRARGARGAA
jgi:1-acyl-sn-glycerol-3-phosphate acyltransferase